jgi:hypothetical protein
VSSQIPRSDEHVVRACYRKSPRHNTFGAQKSCASDDPSGTGLFFSLLHNSPLTNYYPACILADVLERDAEDGPIGAEGEAVGPFDNHDGILRKQVF